MAKTKTKWTDVLVDTMLVNLEKNRASYEALQNVRALLTDGSLEMIALNQASAAFFNESNKRKVKLVNRMAKLLMSLDAKKFAEAAHKFDGSWDSVQDDDEDETEVTA